MRLHNDYTLQSRITPGNDLITRKGAMIAYQGNLEFKHQGARDAGQFMRKMVSNEDQPLMRVSGNGEAYFAQNKARIHLLQLEHEAVTVSGTNLLAFQDSLTYDLTRVKGSSMLLSGMWNTTVSGYGSLAIAAHGEPIIFDCSQQPLFTDMHATVAWSASLQPQVKSSMSAGALIGRGSGEAFQYVFHGPGWVIVQPAEYAA